MLGLNLGFSKNKSKSEKNTTELETLFQDQSTSTTGTQNTASNSTTNNSASGTSNTTQSGTSTQTGTKVNDQTGITSLFGGDVQAGLEGLVTNLLGTAGTKNPATSGLAFDSDAFVRDTVAGAAAKQQTGLDATLGGIADMVGAKAGNSSMGDLLAARATGDVAANLAGVRSQAEATAAGIENQSAQTQLAGEKTDADVLAGFLAALKGGTQVSTQTGSEATTAAGTTTAVGSTATSESSTQNTAATQTQTIQQLVDALLNSTRNTTGTEKVKGSGSGVTGGVTASAGK